MAKIKYSALVSDMRNKLNGSVMTKNRYGSMVRNKVTPTNPQSQAQQLRRMQFGSLASSWRGLSPVQQDSWTNGAPNFPIRDIFGDVKIYSGATLYQKLNSNLYTIGGGTIVICPTPVEFPLFDIAFGETQTDELTVIIDPVTVPLGMKLVLYATPPISAGRRYVKNLFKLITTDPPLTSGVADIILPYVAVFGQIPAGSRIAVRAVLIDAASGQMGVPLEIQAPINV